MSISNSVLSCWSPRDWGCTSWPKAPLLQTERMPRRNHIPGGSAVEWQENNMTKTEKGKECWNWMKLVHLFRSNHVPRVATGSTEETTNAKIKPWLGLTQKWRWQIARKPMPRDCSSQQWTAWTNKFDRFCYDCNQEPQTKTRKPKLPGNCTQTSKPPVFKRECF